MGYEDYELIRGTCVKDSNGRLILYKLPKNKPNMIDEVFKVIRCSFDWLFNFKKNVPEFRYGVNLCIIMLSFLFSAGEYFRNGSPFIQYFLSHCLVFIA